MQHGYRVDQLQRERAAEEETTRQLRLEVEKLTSPKRIEALATELGMVAPSQAEAVIIERVVPADPPARSVVARR